MCFKVLCNGLLPSRKPGHLAPGFGMAEKSSQYTVETDDEEWYEDSDHLASDDDDNSSVTASLCASIYNYSIFCGRTFHSERGDAVHWAPNDKRQREAMDLFHLAFTIALDGKLSLSPLRADIETVIDIGTGTGSWAIEFADGSPNADVVGTDISPIQPSWTPPNLHWEMEDLTQDFPYPHNTFDFVYMRCLLGSVADWPTLLRNIFACCRPGGWAESLEISISISRGDDEVGDEQERATESPAIEQWGRMFQEAGEKMGRTFRVVEDGVQRTAMEQAGFVDIEEHEFKCPIGGWPQDPKWKQVGQMCQAALEHDTEGYILYPAGKIMGWSKAQIKSYANCLRRELRNNTEPMWFRTRVVNGRKR